MDDACSLAALGALSFDADQARAAEWYDTNVPRTIPDSAVRRAASFFTPPPLDEDAPASRAQRTLKRMDAEALSAFSAVVYTALGSARAAMSMIADIARREIDWQLALLRPMYNTVPPGPPPAPQSAAKVDADADKVVQPWARNFLKRKRKCRAPEALLLGVPDAPPSPRKRSKLASGAYYCTVPERSETPPPAGSRYEDADDDEGEGEWGDEEDYHVVPSHHHHGGRLWRRLAIGPPENERKEEESITAVGHAREEDSEVPEFGTCRRASQVL